MQGWAHLLVSLLQVAVISEMLVRDIDNVAKGVERAEEQLKTKDVGTVFELVQFSVVPHFGDCPNI